MERARQMRTQLTIPEATVWKMLRAKRLNGWKFSRQVPIGPYIADFGARSAKLVVELDGRSHDNSADYDARRDAFMEGLGYRVVRFSNREVSTNLDDIASHIDHVLASLSPTGKGRETARSVGAREGLTLGKNTESN